MPICSFPPPPSNEQWVYSWVVQVSSLAWLSLPSLGLTTEPPSPSHLPSSVLCGWNSPAAGGSETPEGRRPPTALEPQPPLAGGRKFPGPGDPTQSPRRGVPLPQPVPPFLLRPPVCLELNAPSHIYGASFMLTFLFIYSYFEGTLSAFLATSDASLVMQRMSMNQRHRCQVTRWDWFPK